MHARASDVSLPRLIGKSSEEPSQGIRLPLLAVLLALGLLFVVDSARSMPRIKALSSEEEILDDLHGQSLAKKGTLELQAGLLRGVEE